MKFSHAWDHLDENEIKSWSDEIKKEFEDIKSLNVWKVMSKSGDMRPIGMKWVFKKKLDGRYRSQLTVLGYRQIYGVDYTEIHAPLLNETDLRLLLLIKIKNKWSIRKLDVEAEFFEEE